MLKTVQDFIKLMSRQKRELYASLVLSFFDGWLIVVPLLAAFHITARMPEFNPDVAEVLTMPVMIRYSLIMLASIFARIVLRYLVSYLRSGAGYKCMAEERKTLGKELRKVPLGFFNEKNLGDVVSTITSDAAFLEIEGMGVIEKVAVGIPVFIIALMICLSFDYRIFLLVLVLLIPTWFAYRYLATRQDALKLNRQKLIGQVTEDTIEFIKGLPVLKSYNMTEKQFSKTQDAYERLRAFSVRGEFVHIPPMGMYQLCFRLITTGIVFLSGLFLLNKDFIFPQAFLLMLASFSLFTGAEAMGIFSIFAKMTQQSIDRMNQIKTIPKLEDISGTEKLERYDICFEHVDFAYNKTPVLRDVSFCVPEGTTTALVGLSGSGKTTITNLIARFWDILPGHGEISIGGKAVKTLSYENLLKNISFVFQDVFLFNDTVLNNIRIGRPDATIEEVCEAARRAGCAEFIEAMEDGYNTVIGEAGARLSGGEKQRISIARALLKDAPIILLDEVTANVDAENEQLIQTALQELLKNKTVIMIAHKLSTIQNADQILVLENGTISQRGSHAELIAQGGLYRRLWDIQYEAEQWRM
ncbi:ABC transporter ATP-binding protein [Treponema sp. OMZ 855]|uniref:ABC transporter ATP-binding protein n=1 Tax=Treponema sp. OMZ 855 TaxID=1643512 RepID=UPI0020A50FF9|nr:ABC transporter ATP-binding protein [Treponema sp. OMZ 855]UTC49798.1 ABC transporter ATP-binding protein [Treponema sp. OMZ 855]